MVRNALIRIGRTWKWSIAQWFYVPTIRNTEETSFGQLSRPTTRPPVYNKFLAWAGYEDAAATITEGWAEKDREKTSSALTDELIDEIAIIGTEGEIRERVQEDSDGGVHTHIIAPLAGNIEDLERTFAAFTADKFQLS